MGGDDISHSRFSLRLRSRFIRELSKLYGEKYLRFGPWSGEIAYWTELNFEKVMNQFCLFAWITNHCIVSYFSFVLKIYYVK